MASGSGWQIADGRYFRCSDGIGAALLETGHGALLMATTGFEKICWASGQPTFWRVAPSLSARSRRMRCACARELLEKRRQRLTVSASCVLRRWVLEGRMPPLGYCSFNKSSLKAHNPLSCAGKLHSVSTNRHPSTPLSSPHWFPSNDWLHVALLFPHHSSHLRRRPVQQAWCQACSHHQHLAIPQQLRCVQIFHRLQGLDHRVALALLAATPQIPALETIARRRGSNQLHSLSNKLPMTPPRLEAAARP